MHFGYVEFQSRRSVNIGSFERYEDSKGHLLVGITGRSLFRFATRLTSSRVDSRSTTARVTCEYATPTSTRRASARDDDFGRQTMTHRRRSLEPGNLEETEEGGASFADNRANRCM